MIITKQIIETDGWVKGSWEEFLALANQSQNEKAKFYYHQGYMRVEMSPVGFRHGRQNALISKIINIFTALKDIPVVEATNASFRKSGLDEFQPDSAFYIGWDLKIPPETNSPVDLNEYNSPTLVIEIASSSLNDDLGYKRLLYERANVLEYWVVNATERKIIAFAISEGRSGQIEESQVLPGLSIAIVEEALQRSVNQKDSQVMRWLMQTFS
ncbi:MAG TPA: Uma2 family endonuclease [Halomicronema sp.]